MNIGTYFVAVFASYYFRYFLNMLNIESRRGTQYANKRMDELRKIPLKTTEEQKEFVGLRYPIKRNNVKTKWTFKRILNIIIMMIFYLGIFLVWLKLFAYLHLDFKLWQAIIIIFVGPIIINFVLKRFGLQKDDVTVFLK